jgi:hypothetical protein
VTRCFPGALLLLVLALFWSSPAAAQDLTLFSDPTAFARATGSDLPCVDFDELESLTQYAQLSYGGVTFSSASDEANALMALGPDALPALSSTVLLANRETGTEPEPLVVEFSPAVTAVGLEVLSLLNDGSISPAGSSIVLTVEGREGSQTLELQPGAATFIGLIAETGSISKIKLSNPAGQKRFVAVDNVCYGDAGEPTLLSLDRLAAAIAAGRRDGTIVGLGDSLEAKVKAARAAAEAGDLEGAEEALTALAHEIRAQRGKKITAATADALLALIQESLDALGT